MPPFFISGAASRAIRTNEWHDTSIAFASGTPGSLVDLKVDATGNLSARLRVAQGRRPDDVVEVSEKPITQLAAHLHLGRPYDYNERVEKRVLALTPEAVNAALRKYINPEKLVIVRAGAFRVKTSGGGE